MTSPERERRMDVLLYHAMEGGVNATEAGELTDLINDLKDEAKRRNSASKWRPVAERLAQQMAAHADCEIHPEDQSQKGCPSCDDRSAYAAWLGAGGRDYRPVDPPGTRTVSVWELRAEHEGIRYSSRWREDRRG